MNPYLTFVIIAVAVIIFWIIWVYNRLTRSKIRSQEAWSDIDIQLKRRHSLIPNLVESVKGYAKHESGVFEKVSQARAQAMSAGSIDEQSKAENMLSSALKSLFAVSEAYPDLKASQNFMKLQDELSDTENKIQASRRFYNGNVRDYNIHLQIFPQSIVAKMLGFEKLSFFEIENDEEKKDVEVKFS